jgi:4-hydroxybenzoate polyprenyltransferase
VRLVAILADVQRVVALVRSSHPEPTAAVTVLSPVVAAAAGRSASGCVLVALAVLCGQLSIGWSNDLIDVVRDRSAGRQDKPVATGELPTRVVAAAAGLAAAGCVPLSLASGWRAGAAHLVAVAGGWSYNLGLKRTVLSFLPYAVSFGLLTAFITLGLPGHPAPPWWLVLGGSLLGVGAHCLNVVPDLADDAAAGIRGMPHRLGERGARTLGGVLLTAASASVTFGPGPPVPGWAYVGLGLAALLAAASAGLGAGTGSRLPFLMALATAAVAVALFVGRGSALG